MIKRLLIILSFLLIASPCIAGPDAIRAVIAAKNAAAPAAEPCNSAAYDFSNGDNESFEAGDGSFCTADWAITDTDGVINTSDTNWNFCGSSAFSINVNSSNTNTNKIVANFGAADTDFYWRSYLKIPAVPSYASINLIWFAQYSTGTAIEYIAFKDASANTNVQIYLEPGEYFTVTDGDEVRVDAHIVANSTSTLKCWRKNGASWDVVETNNGGGDVEASGTNTNATGARYIIFNQSISGTFTGQTFYIDDVLVDLDGAGYIGAQTCQ